MKRISRSKLVVAIIYSLISSIGLNMFWLPGNIYANGLTGLSQLLVQLGRDYAGLHLTLPAVVLLFNLPLLLLAWYKIDRTFTWYTIFAVVLTSVVMKLVPVIQLTRDPVICGVFGGVLHGFSVGLTLNSDFSTGGLDIIGILVKKVTGRSIGSFFIAFNLILQFFAGALYGWQYAFYSAAAVFISGRVVDYVNVKQKRVQVLIVTEHAQQLTACLQADCGRGITVINDVEGAFDHQQKKLLMMVVSQRELKLVKAVVEKVDRKAFVSVASGISANRVFYEY